MSRRKLDYSMSNDTENTLAEEVKATEPTISEVAVEAVPAETKEETVGEALNSQKEDNSVPLAKFLDMKSENKAMAKELKEIKLSVEQGASKKEVSSDLKSLAEKHDVDVSFLEDFAKTVRAQADSDIDEKVASRLKPLEEKDRAQKVDTAFNKHFTKAMENMQEFDGIVNKDVIKSLSLNPANANKTFKQLIEDSYGHLIQGKRTIDSASTRAGKNDSMDVDLDRAKQDKGYFDQVMADPSLKQKYNDSLVDSLASHL